MARAGGVCACADALLMMCIGGRACRRPCVSGCHSVFLCGLLLEQSDERNFAAADAMCRPVEPPPPPAPPGALTGTMGMGL